VDYVQGYYLGKPQSTLGSDDAGAEDSFNASVA
jgi:EAL domain-containing protein (putative c-di-GMP-specific phosphodiesterase class I)